MPGDKKLIPVAMCNVCHLVIYDAARIDTQCTSRSGNYRCSGIMKSTSQKNDWTECQHCEATGLIEGAPCRHCRGVGWIFIRQGGFDGRQPAGMPIVGHTY